MHHLPPLSLRFRLPPCYPSSQPPAYTLSCPWLAPGHLTSLQLQLDSIYADTGGGVVLFSWLSFLQVIFLSGVNLDRTFKIVVRSFESYFASEQ